MIVPSGKVTRVDNGGKKMDKLSIEEWDSLTPEEQETRLDEMPEELAEPGPQGDGGVGDVDEKGVPLKNRLEEAKRKKEAAERKLEGIEQKNTEMKNQITKLQKQIASATTPTEKNDALTEMENELTKLGYEKELIGIVKTAVSKLGGQSPQISTEVEQLRALVGGVLQNTILDKAIKDDKYGVIKKHEDEVRQELSMLPPKVQGSPEAVEWVVNKIKSKYFGEGMKGARPSGSATLPPSSETTAVGFSADEEEARKYANETGMDIKRARQIVEKRKKAEETRNK